MCCPRQPHQRNKYVKCSVMICRFPRKYRCLGTHFSVLKRNTGISSPPPSFSSARSFVLLLPREIWTRPSPDSDVNNFGINYIQDCLGRIYRWYIQEGIVEIISRDTGKPRSIISPRGRKIIKASGRLEETQCEGEIPETLLAKRQKCGKMGGDGGVVSIEFLTLSLLTCYLIRFEGVQALRRPPKITP